MTVRRKRIAVAGVFGLIAIAAWLWFAANGSGESRDSPDGRYTAHAYNMVAGNWHGERQHYIEIRVTEVDSGRELWCVVHRHAPGADVPEYGMRGIKFAEWAADSSSVTVPVGGGRQLVLVVP